MFVKKTRPWLRFIEGTEGASGSATPPAGDAGQQDPAAGNGGQTTPPAGETTPPAATGTGEAPKEDTGDQGENPDARGSKQSVLADLARERDKRQALEAERDELKSKVTEFERAQMTEAEKAEADRKELEAKYTDAAAKLAAYERANTLKDLTKKFNIPAAMADRIQGTTPEEMRADAEALAKSLGPYTGPSDPSAGKGGGKPAPATSLAAGIAAHYATK